MLLATVLLWALNLTVSRYILLHGFQPLSYATVRYGFAAAIFLAVAGGLGIARSDWWLVAVAAVLLFLNQIAFVYALERTTAATVGLILGSLPIFAGLIGLAVGLERLPGRFWPPPPGFFRCRRPSARRQTRTSRSAGRCGRCSRSPCWARS